MSKEAEKEVKVSPRKVKRVKKALAEIQALKKALKEDPEWKKYDNPGVSSLDLLLFMEGKFSALDGKLSWLLGTAAICCSFTNSSRGSCFLGTK